MSSHGSARKEKRSGGFRRFFKAMTTKGGGASSERGGASDHRVSPRAVLPSGDNQFAIAMGDSTVVFRGNGTAPPHRSPPKANSISSATRVHDASSSSEHASPNAKPDANVVRWGLVLSQIPKLVAESTSVSLASSSSSPSGSANNSPTASGVSSSSTAADASPPSDMTPLLESLRQMATKECQTQILQYYTGHAHSGAAYSHATVASSGMNNINVLSNWEQRKVFKQCRRSLLLCWKFIIAQLNDEKAHKMLPSDTRETYYQLLALIAERVEFNLLTDPKDAVRPSGSSSGRPPIGSKARSGSQTGPSMGYVSSVSPSSSSTGSTMHSFDTGDNNNASTDDSSSSEGERDLYLYRCLLVATFKHVVDSIDAAQHKKRPFITFAESQFFAKVLAICFVRVPVVQRMVLDGVYEAYRYKKWTKPTPSSTTPHPGTPNHAAAMQSRLNRRRSSSKPVNSMTFEGTLARWCEFEGLLLTEFSEEENNQEMDGEGKTDRDYSDKLSESSSSGSSDHNYGNPFAPPSRSVMDKYKRANPTLFRWSRYSPYLLPYADSDVFRTYEASHAGWLHKLLHDGEFFSLFMTSYIQHVDLVSVGGEPVWYCLPGYPLLIRVSLLLVKETAWKKWLAVRDTTNNIVHRGGGNHSSNQDDNEPIAFHVESTRSLKTVMDNVVHLLKNREVLESVVLAVFECTNVLNAKSVSVCLSRLEEWFSAAAERVSEKASGEVISYRLPTSFHGYALGTAVRIMLCSESFEILNRVLLFLYNRMDYFDGELRQSVLKAVVQRHMYLFLHWNTDVRHTYHHLLVYKIVRTNRYLLDSPIDQLLVGRFAMLHDSRAGREDRDGSAASSVHHHSFDDVDSAFDEIDARPVLTAAEFNVLRLEQALWRAFDACLASICVQERRHARDANRKYQVELQAARSRAVAFQKLNIQSANGDDANDRTSSVNEGLPGHKASQEFDLLNEELNREPPYYLRYLPAEEVSSLDELRRLAQSVKYPAELQVYAAASLRGYSDLLKQYFDDLRARGYAEAPPLGFV